MQTQVLVLAIFFRKTTPTPALEAAGLISAVIGLVLFLEGLRVAIMPMAMLVGTQLPQRLKLPLVLVVAFCLGVLVTYAEPAIAAIRWAVPCRSESSCAEEC
jgi:membrane associated rhomboid family serine protease